MDKQEYTYSDLNEKLFIQELDNGLKLILIPKKGYTKYFCSFSTDFGGIDYKFINKNTNEINTIPFGVAHFLEHKLFEMPNGIDATQAFSRMGVDSNAYTDFNQTSYIISGIDHLEEAITFLLDFVQTPYFTDENVKKEQGIIIQEYKMYADEPSEILQKKLMTNMYTKVPYFEDIVGNVESIKKIDKSTLYLAYNTFYHPSNMIFLAIGDFDIDKISSLVESNQKSKTFESKPNIKKIYEDDFDINKNEDEIVADITSPKATLAIKINKSNDDAFILELKIKILLELACGVLSSNYQEMLDKKLINSSFGYSVRIDSNPNYNYGFIKITSDSFKAKEFIKYIKEKILLLKTLEISNHDFEVMKKALIGSSIMSFNDVENIAINYVDTYYKNSNLFNSLNMIKNLKVEDLDDTKKLFDEKHMSVLIMNPKK